jgi:UDP-N-acetylglucosamine--N-acetylmuramyl-(pentapeptide) pyrophosphoryl-undecaprenol N-acetylglucosamine transferase
MRLLIAGGGTGGHLFPGVAIAEELRAREPDAAIKFVGTRRGIEARV